jgi:5'-3' exonuclease
MIEKGATHLGVATDHVIESFRNDLWPGYKTGDGIDPVLWKQFIPLEEALAAMGVAVWPMVELEADDGLASAARIATEDSRVEKISIWANDKDLAQCVRGERVVQVDRRGMQIRDAAGVKKKFGVEPALIPDFLALVGDAQDGYPGIPGIGAVTAARMLNQYGPIERFPSNALGEAREDALLFKRLATLRDDARLFENVDELEWRGPTASFEDWVTRLGDPKLLERARKAPAPSPDRSRSGVHAGRSPRRGTSAPARSPPPGWPCRSRRQPPPRRRRRRSDRPRRAVPESRPESATR